ncbi:hypothetical protein GRS48_06050 [Halorubrum sp. JWXQ-INN 858]|uniref:hypothetical protein n=1 Tax=Halorubrum sp. JWXQ-INN 858 TaxID=2690782 RepID=UPI00135B129E|nr:hypothetical protein [Halorubrum sp. JWXQ-INN 858]MWV64386.1 hypothetical protein [Halorubrum sp. JWXQ-INN 858]
MTNQEFHESVVTADKWSKVIALGVAIAAFLLARRTAGDVQFASIVAAAAAIGVRIYVPYHASTRVPEAERTAIHDHPLTGNYHHGAAGLALVALALAALAAFVFGHGFLAAVGVGVISGGVVYVVLASWLPAA